MSGLVLFSIYTSVLWGSCFVSPPQKPQWTLISQHTNCSRAHNTLSAKAGVTMWERKRDPCPMSLVWGTLPHHVCIQDWLGVRSTLCGPSFCPECLQTDSQTSVTASSRSKDVTGVCHRSLRAQCMNLIRVQALPPDLRSEIQAVSSSATSSVLPVLRAGFSSDINCPCGLDSFSPGQARHPVLIPQNSGTVVGPVSREVRIEGRGFTKWGLSDRCLPILRGVLVLGCTFPCCEDKPERAMTLCRLAVPA